MSKVDFFIVGASKSGTTSLYHYLKGHPEIYLPFLKDRAFFGRDLNPVLTKNEYQSFYKDEFNKIKGDCYAEHLYSKHAASEIYSYNPNAKIIALLRNPVDMLYSIHSQLVYSGIETEKDFEAALKKEVARKKYDLENKLDYSGRKLLYYSELVKYSEQLERYINLFGKKNVLVFTFDNFVKSPKNVYLKVIQFVGVKDKKYFPEFKRYNPNKTSRSKLLQKFISHPPEKLRKIFWKLFPLRLRYWLTNFFVNINTNYVKRKEMPASLEEMLKHKYKPEVIKLEKLLRVNLSQWY